MITKILIWLLKNKKLSLQERTELTIAITGKLGAFPIKEVIDFDQQGTIILKGNKIEPEQALTLKQGAMALRDNWTRKLINEQRIFNAIKIGVYNGVNPEQIYFSKAILWCIEQEEDLLNKLDQS